MFYLAFWDGAIKHDICNWYLGGTMLSSNKECSNITLTTTENVFKKCQRNPYCLQTLNGTNLYLDMLTFTWAYNKYWRTDKILEYYVDVAYIKEDGSDNQIRSYSDSVLSTYLSGPNRDEWDIYLDAIETLPGDYFQDDTLPGDYYQDDSLPGDYYQDDTLPGDYYQEDAEETLSGDYYKDDADDQDLYDKDLGINPASGLDSFDSDLSNYPYYFWHYLHGIPLFQQYQFGTIRGGLVESIPNDDIEGSMGTDENVMITEGADYDVKKCLKEHDLDSKECQTMYSMIKNINETKIKLIESWMNQPKIHGNEYEDYVLVPLCSFAENDLKECAMFKPSELKSQDQKCFTYDAKRHANVGPTEGFKFLLNLQNLPHDKSDLPLSVDLYLHESGSYPDIFNVKTFPTKILATEKVVKIGVSLTNREITKNFEKMTVKKRRCISSDDTKEKYTKSNCVMDTVHNLSAEKCGCSPRNTNPHSHSKPICDMKGAICFREWTNTLRAEFNTSSCKQECTGIDYNANKRVEDNLELLSQGSQYVDFLWRNPIGEMINGKKQTMTNPFFWYYGYSIRPLDKFDLIEIGKRYSLVQVYFENPMKNVITQDAKVTLAGMVSNIGGTLGIFLGLSMITLFDDLYQIFIYIKAIFVQKKNSLFS